MLNVSRTIDPPHVAARNLSPRREPMLRPSQNSFATVARRNLMIALIAAMACVACAPLLAQVTSGTIFGTVKDPTGAMVEDASVTIANPANGITRKVVTGSDGAFAAPNLYP